MMKKLLPLSAVAIGVMFSAQAAASSGSIADSASLTPDTAGGTNICEALSNNVTIQVSAGVVASWNCSDTSFTAATCHTTGTNKQQTITCSYQQDKDASGVLISGSYTASANECPAYDGTGTLPTKATFFGRIAYKGTSAGGKVAPTQMYNQTTCNLTTIQTLTPTP